MAHPAGAIAGRNHGHGPIGGQVTSPPPESPVRCFRCFDVSETSVLLAFWGILPETLRNLAEHSCCAHRALGCFLNIVDPFGGRPVVSLVMVAYVAEQQAAIGTVGDYANIVVDPHGPEIFVFGVIEPVEAHAGGSRG